MTVKIDIGANPGSVVTAFERIKEALRQAKQAAADFAAEDMSHPELAALEAQVKRLTLAMQTMRAAAGSGVVFTQGGTSASPARPQGSGAPSAPIVPPTVVVPGVPTVPPVPPQPAPPPPPLPRPQPPPRRNPGRGGGGGGGGGGAAAAAAAGGIGDIMGALAGPIRFALSLAGVGAVKQMVGQAVGQASGEAIANDRLLRTLRDSTADFETLRTKVRGAAGSIGATFGETQAMALRYGRVAGTGVGSLINQVTFAGGLARGYGIDQATMADIQARGENAGLPPSQLAFAAGDVTREGGLQGRTEEVMRALLKWSEGATRQTINQNYMTQFASMYAGLNATGFAGFKGANAESLIGTINSSLTQGGAAGMASQVLTYRALAAHGVTDPYEQKYITAGGMFAPISDKPSGDHTTLYDAEMEQLNREGRGLSAGRRDAMIAGQFGINVLQARSLREHYTPGQVGQTQKLLTGYGITDMSKINASGLADIGDVVGASPERLKQIRDKALGRSDLSMDERRNLYNASGENLRKGLVTTFATHGMEGTQGSETVDANAKLSNSITALGTTLLDPLNSMKAGVGELVKQTAAGVTLLEDFLKNGVGKNMPDGNAVVPLPGGGSPTIPFIPASYRVGGARLPPNGGFGLGGPSLGGGPIRMPNNLAADRSLPLEARALLDTIAGPESKGDYSIINGGNHFSDFSRHPNWLNPNTDSTAAGRYQEIKPTWDAANRAAGGGLDFSPVGQDRGTWALAVQTYKQKTGGDLLTDLRDASKRGRIQTALGGTDLWTSLNLGGYEANLARETGSGSQPTHPVPSMAGTPAPMLQKAGFGGNSARIEPLRVIHQTASGRVIREELLPVQQQGLARAWAT